MHWQPCPAISSIHEGHFNHFLQISHFLIIRWPHREEKTSTRPRSLEKYEDLTWADNVYRNKRGALAAVELQEREGKDVLKDEVNRKSESCNNDELGDKVVRPSGDFGLVQGYLDGQVCVLNVRLVSISDVTSYNRS